MTIIMLTSLYTSRIVLSVLGIDDYGIYNVVAGFVSLFTFLSSTISSGTSRFFAFEIGRSNSKNLHNYFRLSVLAFVLLSLIIFVLAETLGLWFVENKLVIPESRYYAALVVYQFSVLSFIVNMFSIPYKSMIIAQERFAFYAYLSIFEVILLLLSVFLLKHLSYDKLILYGLFHLLISFFVLISFYLYSRFHYTESRYSFYWNRSMFNEFFNYSFWIIIGGLSSVLRGQGLNIVLNLFFGPVVNAARGVAYHIHSAINQFVNNFYTACRPQITKLYAAGEREQMMNLVFSSSRICYLLTLFFTLPIIIETPMILNIWLEEVPDYSVVFTRLVLLTILIEAISYPFQTAVSATGKIKWYQVITGGLTILTLPIAYAFLREDYPPEIVFYVTLIMAILAQFSRILFMKYLLSMSVMLYLKDVILRILLVSLTSIIVPLLLYINMNSNICRFIGVILTSTFLVLLIGYFFGITRNERNTIKRYLKEKVRIK